MKPTRFLTVVLVLLGLVATASAITQEGTVITNQAFGNYEDANGNSMPQVESLVVSTTVSQVAGVSLGTDKTANVSAMDSTLYTVTLSNTGNGSDTYTIGATGAANDGGTYDFYVYHDGGTLGVLDGSDESTEITSSGLIAFTGDYNLIVKVVDRTDGGGNSGEQHVVTLTATSSFATAVKDTITLTSTITAATVSGTTEIVGNNNPEPGDPITYESCFTNSGSEIAYNGVYEVTMPSNTTLSLTSVSINGGSAVTVKTDSTTNYYYDIPSRTLTLELGNLAADGGVCVTFTAILDDPLAAGASIQFPAGSPNYTYENGGGDAYPIVVPTEDPGTFPDGGDVTVAQTYGVTLTDGGDDYDFTGDPGDTLVYDFTVTNNGNGDDSFTLSDTSDFVTWVFYLDGNKDGVLSAAEKALGAISVTGTLPAAPTTGSTEYYIAIGTIPVGTADGASDANILIAATSVGATTTTSSTGSASATCTAPVLSLVKSVTHNGTTYYSGTANEAAPGDTLTYTILVVNSGTGIAKNVAVSDAINTNTTYVAESMAIDGSADDDNNTVDTGETADNASKEASSVLFDFDTIPAANAGDTDQHTLTFKVTIK
ncbi:MAG: DUF11 domain-containing protein [Candidatus Marinimicrobia bacterium]|nr:DUF11 domain-containing protein [Candidatus Neomarinimicrobiota bacterium]MCF7921195.1 DUF11 domain-containing protein [Candidatus Neomarinimicrobiota bacterium]